MSTTKISKETLVVGLVWWTTLVVAVVAVPLIGGVVALAATKSAFLQMAVFALTCWASVWLGMWLMRQSALHHLGWNHKKKKK